MKQIVTLYDVLRKAQDSGVLRLLENANCTRTNYSEWLIIYETYLQELHDQGRYGALQRTAQRMSMEVKTMYCCRDDIENIKKIVRKMKTFVLA